MMRAFRVLRIFGRLKVFPPLFSLFFLSPYPNVTQDDALMQDYPPLFPLIFIEPYSKFASDAAYLARAKSLQVLFFFLLCVFCV